MINSAALETSHYSFLWSGGQDPVIREVFNLWVCTRSFTVFRIEFAECSERMMSRNTIWILDHISLHAEFVPSRFLIVRDVRSSFLASKADKFLINIPPRQGAIQDYNTVL
jgi:hypothetical protein